MTEHTYTTYVTYGDPWRFLCERYGISEERAKAIYASEPWQPGSRMAQLQAVRRMVAKARAES